MSLSFAFPAAATSAHVRVATHRCRCNAIADRRLVAAGATRKTRRSRSGEHRRAVPGSAPDSLGRGSAIQAVWKGCVLARSSEYLYLEGRFYFPRESVNWELLTDADTQGHRNPYGRIDFFDVRVEKGLNRKAAWRFADLRKPYQQLSGFTAFWKGVSIIQAPISSTSTAFNLEDMDWN